MNIEIFWSMIEDSRQKSELNNEDQLGVLASSLSQLPPQSIEEFDRLLWMMMARAYRADLWEAASLAACGCTDDGFDDFRGWLIAQGKTTYERVLDDPDNLSDIVDKEERFNIFNGLTAIAQGVYERKTGHEISVSGYGEEVDLDRPLIPYNERSAKYPRIMAKLGDCADQ